MAGFGRLARLIAICALVLGSAVTAAPAFADGDRATDWDAYSYHPNYYSCAFTRYQYQEWAWVSDCEYDYFTSEYYFGYTCRICLTTHQATRDE